MTHGLVMLAATLWSDQCFKDSHVTYALQDTQADICAWSQPKILSGLGILRQTIRSTLAVSLPKKSLKQPLSRCILIPERLPNDHRKLSDAAVRFYTWIPQPLRSDCSPFLSDLFIVPKNSALSLRRHCILQLSN